MNKPNLNRCNKKEVEMFVAADSVGLFFGKAEYKNPFAYTRSLINYQNMNCKERNLITERFEDALQQFAGDEKDEWSNYHCNIYYADEEQGPSIVVDAGFFRIKIYTNKKGSFIINTI